VIRTEALKIYASSLIKLEHLRQHKEENIYQQQEMISLKVKIRRYSTVGDVERDMVPGNVLHMVKDVADAMGSIISSHVARQR